MVGKLSQYMGYQWQTISYGIVNMPKEEVKGGAIHPSSAPPLLISPALPWNSAC